MQRMFITGVREVVPDAEIHFACLPEYMDAAIDHPDISKVLNTKKVDDSQYTFKYNTCVTISDRYENKNSPNCDEHRSDIWAKYCGFEIKNHDMKFRPNPEYQDFFRNKIRELNPENKPVVVFSPISKMESKTLRDWQTEHIVNVLKENNLFVLGSHREEIPLLKKLNVGGLYNLKIQEWIAAVSVCDYVVSVDSALFHLGGGLNKPMTGIFTFIDGKVYGKWFKFSLVQKHRDNGNWDCGPCFKYSSCPKSRGQPKPCLTELTKEEFTNGIMEMLNTNMVKNAKS